MGEIWKPIPTYEGLYDVSNLGRIRSYQNNKWGLSPNPKILFGRQGRHYKTVILCKDGKRETKLIHRIVAESFVLNPNKFSVVNHKDGNKTNNCAENLEWCTAKQNTRHAAEMGLTTFNAKSVVCCETGKKFHSITNAAKYYKILRTSIDNCLSGKSKTAGGYHWKYERMDVI